MLDFEWAFPDLNINLDSICGCRNSSVSISGLLL
jgi:hypothetical protein